MNETYTNKSIVEIGKTISKQTGSISLDGNSLSIQEILSVSRNYTLVNLTNNAKILSRIQHSYKNMMNDVKKGIPIYGCNTAYGQRASIVLNSGSIQERINLAKQISEAITHVDVSVGPTFDKEITRGAMLIRINMLLKGVSAVKLEDLEIYTKMLNKKITPVVNQYGGIGASGDLAHNCRVLNAARQLSGVKVVDQNNTVLEASKALTKSKIPKLDLDPKAGLGLVNGDNFSTSVATLLTADTLHALILSTILGAMTIEVLLGTNRSFHPMLSKTRHHKGQHEVSSLYRYLLEGSNLAFQEMQGHKSRKNNVIIQDGYSLRCIPQYHGVNFERIKQILDVITVNANSVSDNPLWVLPEYTTKNEVPGKWVSGGNFLAMHMAEALDSLRKIMTQMIKINDRHLARLVTPTHNNGLSANLSDKKAISQCAFKGVQIQAGMFDVYSSLLSIPVTTFFGVHEEGNQDITSHALTSGILGLENLRLLRYSIAQNLLALAQAIDLRGDPKKLSPRTRPIYQFIREKVKYVAKERPLNEEIEILYQAVKDGELSKIAQEKVFKNYASEK